MIYHSDSIPRLQKQEGVRDEEVLKARKGYDKAFLDVEERMYGTNKLGRPELKILGTQQWL